MNNKKLMKAIACLNDAKKEYEKAIQWNLDYLADDKYDRDRLEALVGRIGTSPSINY